MRNMFSSTSAPTLGDTSQGTTNKDQCKHKERWESIAKDAKAHVKQFWNAQRGESTFKVSVLPHSFNSLCC